MADTTNRVELLSELEQLRAKLSQVVEDVRGKKVSLQVEPVVTKSAGAGLHTITVAHNRGSKREHATICIDDDDDEVSIINKVPFAIKRGMIQTADGLHSPASEPAKIEPYGSTAAMSDITDTQPAIAADSTANDQRASLPNTNNTNRWLEQHAPHIILDAAKPRGYIELRCSICNTNTSSKWVFIKGIRDFRYHMTTNHHDVYGPHRSWSDSAVVEETRYRELTQGEVDDVVAGKAGARSLKQVRGSCDATSGILRCTSVHGA
ncbi:hypothetical protein LTR78_001741 [Recurvomyces mirabilis]|uniref:Uncharacterized protein n=1 Tax=Recurvomyces mirabilis TaxID=574656 RepID=A0AAE0WUS2_9PEZI|nr:hypothetical protein LTR78_001741 [Recurvomyces mirabilis]KAK5150184.1 hypothetical protein LTS14_010313 [Recurvomyces mirabilis]